MNHLKKLLLCTFVFFSSYGSFAQSFPYKSNDTTTGYTLVWQDDFNGTTLDETNNWVVELNGNGGGNNELEYYRRENISVGKEPVTGVGCLIISAKKESYAGKTCTSGRLKTYSKMSFKHGKIEARIKLPHTTDGLWPAFWMMGVNYGWPTCGEIDIMEMGSTSGKNAGTQNRYYSSWYHWGESWQNHPNWGQAITVANSIQDDFHLFTLIWNTDYVETYLDLDVNPSAAPLAHMAINQADVAPNPAHYFHQQFYVLFNLAIGGDFTGIHDISNVTALNAANNYTANMYVDYVKVYQQGTADEAYTGPALIPSTGLNEVKAEDEYRIYPNPANDHITIEANNDPIRVTILNMAGQVVLSVANMTSIDTSSLPSGNYLVKITDKYGKVETHQMTRK